MEYSFWRVWVLTFEGNRRWYIARFFENIESYEVLEIVKGQLTGGVGDDSAEILEVETWYDEDGNYRDYCYLFEN